MTTSMRWVFSVSGNRTEATAATRPPCRANHSLGGCSEAITACSRAIRDSTGIGGASALSTANAAAITSP